jgi:hypothetical protein
MAMQFEMHALNEAHNAARSAFKSLAELHGVPMLPPSVEDEA